MDNKKLSAVILIDLSKAFDSISHSILLNELSAIGVSKETVEWFESYLTRRFQKVRIGSSSSAALPITHGVPQGTILSPLLFCIYTNDLPAVTQSCDLNSFVDDFITPRYLCHSLSKKCQTPNINLRLTFAL